MYAYSYIMWTPIQINMASINGSFVNTTINPTTLPPRVGSELYAPPSWAGSKQIKSLSRSAASSQSATELSWTPLHRRLESEKTNLSHKSRPLTVYDTVPPGIGGRDYSRWTEEWLPRLTASRGAPGQKRLNPISRNPIGFAISPRSSTASSGGEIGPTVLHFNGRKKSGDAVTRSSRTSRSKPLRHVYTKSVFRRDESPDKADTFHHTRPMSTRKNINQRAVTPSTAGALPDRYQLPADGQERQNMSAILPEVRLENYMEPEKRKYVILSQSVNSATLPPEVQEVNSHNTYDGKLEEQLGNYGVRANTYNMISVTITRKGTLCHGNAWKTADPPPESDDVKRMVVENTGARSRLPNTIKVKDVAPDEV